MATTAIFGAGVMGETLLSGLLRSGRDAADLVITERNPDRAAQLAEKYDVRALPNPEAAELADLDPAHGSADRPPDAVDRSCHDQLRLFAGASTGS